MKVKKKKKVGKYAGIIDDFGIEAVKDDDDDESVASPATIGGYQDMPDAFKIQLDTNIDNTQEDTYDTPKSIVPENKTSRPLSLVELRKQEEHA